LAQPASPGQINALGWTLSDTEQPVKFEFSDEQEMMRSEARRFLQRECTSSVVRSVLESDKNYDAPLWKSICEMGWTGVAIPERHGGLGAGYLELCVIAEELGRALAPVPLSSSIFLAAEAILRGGDDAQKSEWLPKLASGAAIGTLALGEGPGAASWGRCAAKAEKSGRGFAITGEKWPVGDGMAADVAVVPAIGPGGLGLYLVKLDQPGVERSSEPSFDESRPQARIILRAADAEYLGASNEATLQDVINRAAVLYSFEQLGGAEVCLNMAVAYAKDRFAFGRPIGSFQAIKHKLADLYAQLELARSNCYYGAWALSTNDRALPEAAACARLGISKIYFECAKEGIQVHGGIGFTWALDAHLYYRRSKLLSAVIGGQTRWRETLIQALENRERASKSDQSRVEKALP
jgi:acyl-CoA dehydrogenase